MSLWVVPGIVSVVVIGALAALVSVRRPIAPLWPGAFLCLVAGLLWTVGEGIATFGGSLAQERFGLALLYTGSIPLPALWWHTVVRYARAHEPFAWLESPVVGWAPLAVAAGLWLLMLTNPWHGAFLTPVVGERNEYQWGFRVTLAFNYSLTVAAALLLLTLARRQRAGDLRRGTALLALASLIVLGANAAFVFSSWYAPTFFTGSLLALAAFVLVAALYRTRGLWLLPVALPEILKHDPAGLVLLGRRGRVVFCNPSAEALLAELRLAPDLELLPALLPRLSGSDARDASELAGELLEGGSPGRLYGYGARQLRVSAIAITRRRRPAALALRFEDVTAWCRAEQSRRALEARVAENEKFRSLGVLAGGVAHEFNNRLATIVGGTDLALEREGADAAQRELLSEIADAAQQAAGLTQQLLAYAGRAPLSLRPLSLRDLVSEMRPLLDAAANGALRVHYALEDTPLVRADPARIQQVLVTLVTHAAACVGSSRPGLLTIRTGEIRLRDPSAEGFGAALAPGRHALLETTDAGRGLDEETRRHLFEPFSPELQSDRGLGLPAAQGIVRAHRGAIAVESEPERGTRFRIVFPAVMEEMPASTAAPSPERWRGHGRVLVVDDEPAVRRVARSMLEQLGFEVVTASGGREAIEIFREQAARIRLVLLDLLMPEVSGAEVLEEIHRVDPAARVVLASALADTDAAPRLASAKLAATLRKPYRLRDLEAAARRALEPEDPAEGGA